MLRDAWFAGALLCGIQQRRSVVLGKERLRTSDAFRCLLFMGLMIGGVGEARVGLTAFVFTRAGWRRHHDAEKHARFPLVFVHLHVVLYALPNRLCFNV